MYPFKDQDYALKHKFQHENIFERWSGKKH